MPGTDAGVAHNCQDNGDLLKSCFALICTKKEIIIHCNPKLSVKASQSFNKLSTAKSSLVIDALFEVEPKVEASWFTKFKLFPEKDIAGNDIRRFIEKINYFFQYIVAF